MINTNGLSRPSVQKHRAEDAEKDHNNEDGSGPFKGLVQLAPLFLAHFAPFSASETRSKYAC